MLPILATALLGCVTKKDHLATVKHLESSLQEVNSRLDAERSRNTDLEKRLAAVDQLYGEIAAMKNENEATADRLIALRTDQQSSTSRVDALERERAALRRDLDNQTQDLTANRARWEDLEAALHRYENETPGELVFKLEKDLMNLSTQVELNRRVGESNGERLTAAMTSLQQLIARFNHQMKLLEQYVNEQFVPLAEGLATYLYQDSRRMSSAAGELDELARNVDPYKFRHLVPSVDEEPSAPVESGNDD